jgi:hypothetical protein
MAAGGGQPTPTWRTASLGSTFGLPAVGWSCSSAVGGTNRCWPWVTAVDRWLGHVKGMAGEDDASGSVAVMTVARPQGEAYSRWPPTSLASVFMTRCSIVEF